MKSYQRVFLFVLSVLFLTALLSPWFFLFWERAIEANPGWENYRYPFPRVFTRLFMIFGILLFFLFRRRLKFVAWSELGLARPRERYPDFSKGFFIALGSMVVLGVVMSLFHVFTPFFRLAPPVALERSVKALLAALPVGFLEEIFFRGMIFKGLMADVRPSIAFFAANAFFSAIHFVKPSEELRSAAVGPWTGFEHLARSFEPFLDPASLFPGFLGLFLLGIVLSYAFFRTGSLYLPMGLHAGWIFGLKTLRVWGDFRRPHLGWLFGSSDPKIVSGVATWIGIVLVGVLVHHLTRHRAPRDFP